MKFKILIALIVFSNLAYAQCDYSVSIIGDNSSFQIQAQKIMGIATNISASAKIVNSQNLLVKEYVIWKSVPIARQKTSSPYSLNLKGEKYTISAQIQTACSDSNESNNRAAKKIDVNAGKGISEPLDYDNTIYLKKETGSRTYKSSSEKTKDIGIIVLLAASIMLNIVLIWKR